MSNPSIRISTLDDAPAVADLIHTLGYPLSANEARLRLSRLVSRDDQYLLLAEDHGRAIGLAHGRLVDSLEMPRCVELAVLVVAESHRSQGIGRRLLLEIEGWAKSRSETIILRSQLKREKAHAFYMRLGYQVLKTQHVFQKSLQGTGTP